MIHQKITDVMEIASKRFVDFNSLYVTAVIAAPVQKLDLVPRLHHNTQAEGCSFPACVEDLLKWLSAMMHVLMTSQSGCGSNACRWAWTRQSSYSASQWQHHLLTNNSKVSSTQKTPSNSVRDLDIFYDSDLVMHRTHVQRTVSHNFSTVRQLRSTCLSVLTSTVLTLILSLVLSQLEWRNAIPVSPTSAGVSVEFVCQVDLWSLSVWSHPWC